MSILKKFKRYLLRFDEYITHKIAICANPKPNTTLAYFRYVLQLLEFSFHGVPWFLAVIVLYFTHSLPNSVLKPMFLGLVIDVISIGLIKAVFKRTRPHLNRDDMYGTTGPDVYSFPSGHASRAIMATNLLIYLSDKKFNIFVCYFLIIWSYLTCLSRLLLARHHFLDVVCGILLGYGFYFFVIFIYL